LANLSHEQALVLALGLPPGSAELVAASASASGRGWARASVVALAEAKAEAKVAASARARAAVVRQRAVVRPSPLRRHPPAAPRGTSRTRFPMEPLLVFQRQAAYLWYVPL